MLKRIRAYCSLRSAQRFFNKGKYAEGIAILEKVITFFPKYHFAYLHLGYNLALIGEFSKGEEYLNKALDGNPQNPIYHMYLGLVFYEKGDYSQASDALKKAIGLDPQNILPYNYLALCQLANGDIDGFQKIINEKGVFESSDLQIRLLLALEAHSRKMYEHNSTGISE